MTFLHRHRWATPYLLLVPGIAWLALKSWGNPWFPHGPPPFAGDTEGIGPGLPPGKARLRPHAALHGSNE